MIILLGRLRGLLRGWSGSRFHRMSPELSRWRKFAQLASHHVLGDVHRNKLSAIVDRQRVPDKLGQNRRAPRPGSQNLLLVLVIHRGHLLRQVVVCKWAFFKRSTHVLSPALAPLLRLPAHNT